MSNEKLKAFWKEWKFTVILFIITIVISLSLIIFVKIPLVEGASMEPTYHDGDRVFALTFASYDVGDVVIAKCDDVDDNIIKRVIGLGGDHIEINEEGLFRNDIRVDEPYLRDQDWTNTALHVDMVVPKDEVYVMGDNRKRSNDSRRFGSINRSDVLAVVLFKLNFFD